MLVELIRQRRRLLVVSPMSEAKFLHIEGGVKTVVSAARAKELIRLHHEGDDLLPLLSNHTCSSCDFRVARLTLVPNPYWRQGDPE